MDISLRILIREVLFTPIAVLDLELDMLHLSACGADRAQKQLCTWPLFTEGIQNMNKSILQMKTDPLLRNDRVKLMKVIMFIINEQSSCYVALKETGLLCDEIGMLLQIPIMN